MPAAFVKKSPFVRKLFSKNLFYEHGGFSKYALPDRKKKAKHFPNTFSAVSPFPSLLAIQSVQSPSNSLLSAFSEYLYNTEQFFWKFRIFQPAGLYKKFSRIYDSPVFCLRKIREKAAKHPRRTSVSFLPEINTRQRNPKNAENTL